jgi:hypothetical protein
MERIVQKNEASREKNPQDKSIVSSIVEEQVSLTLSHFMDNVSALLSSKNCMQKTSPRERKETEKSRRRKMGRDIKKKMKRMQQKTTKFWLNFWLWKMGRDIKKKMKSVQQNITNFWLWKMGRDIKKKMEKRMQ